MSSPHHPHPTPLRFCLSCFGTLVCWAVWLGLSGLLAALLYIAIARELPAPEFLLRRVERELTAANLTVRFGRARLDPTGRILVEDVQVRAAQFGEPLLASRQVYVGLNFWSLLAGRPIPDEIRFEGMVLQLPAMLSPSGTAEPVVRDLAGTLHYAGGTWRVDQLAGRVGKVAVTVHGEYALPRRLTGAPPLTVEEITSRFLQVGRRLVLDLQQAEPCEEPALDVLLENVPGVGNTADLFFTARAVRRPLGRPLVIDDLVATATLRLDGRGPRPLRLHVAARRLDYDGQYTAEAVRAIISAQVSPDQMTARPMQALLAAGSLTAFGQTAQAPVVQAALDRWPAVHAEAALQLDGEWLAAEVEAQVKEGIARLHAHGRATPAAVNPALAHSFPKFAPYLVLGDPVAFDASVRFGPSWKFAEVSSRVRGGRLDSHGVAITSTRGRIEIDRLGNFLVYDAEIGAGENSVRGSYWMNFFSHDFRYLLTGRLRPAEIGGWFRGAWWPEFWATFDFSAVPPRADVEVSGCYTEPARTLYFGEAAARNARVLGADFTTAHTVLFVRPDFQHALELSASRADGAQRAHGTFKRYAEPGRKEARALEFDLESNLDPTLYAKLAGGQTAELLAPLQFTQPPLVQAKGWMTRVAGKPVPNLAFTARADDAMRLHGFPLEALAVTGGITGPDFRLDQIDFRVAGGTGRGKASLSGPEGARLLGMEMYLKGADLARTIRIFEEFEAQRTGIAADQSMAGSKFIKRVSGGKLDLAVSAQGDPADPTSFRGGGNAQLTGAELAEIHLFGLLSQVLSAVALNFSSLKLDTARTSFRLEEGRVHFPDLKVSGPSAVIDAHGDYLLTTKTLDFTARFKPYEETSNPLTAAIGIFLNPLTRIFELKLTGPISKPAWSFSLGSSKTATAPAAGPEAADSAAKPPPAPVKK